MRDDVDVLILGSGIAGLFFALKIAPYGSVTIVTKKEQPESNTNYAQGGIAAALAPDDSPALHARDTYSAGAGLCHSDSVEVLVNEGPARIRELIELGACFTRAEGSLSLGREGGHSRRRIVRSSDLTGREVERALLEAVASTPGVEIHENTMAVDLLTYRGRNDEIVCGGAVVMGPDQPTPRAIRARVVLAATGGCGQVYAHTTNPAIATGDGIAMAYRAGAAIANMEFIQFHPTALYPAGDRAFLISEAVRGEGAVLRRGDGTAFMDRHHPLGSLAPRDIVARAIDHELKESGEPWVLLDCSPIGETEIRHHFPNILAETSRRGIDILREPIPVIPAAHYGCGGILTDTSGRTSIDRLYAVGEAACTGVHGANRLASNSLLEALVFAGRAAEHIGPRLAAMSPPPPDAEGTPPSWGAAEAITAPDRERIRTLMWDLVGIVRDDDRLREAADELAALEHRIEAATSRVLPTPDFLELRNLVQCANLIVTSALSRRESRGLHFNIDHPYRDNEHFLRDTVVVR